MVEKRDYTILVDGCGTVGSRVGRAAQSLGYNVIYTKFLAAEEDIKTEELIELRRDLGQAPLYVIEGDNSLDTEKRIKSFKKLELEVAGTRRDIPFRSLTHIVNAAVEGKDTEDYERFYKQYPKTPFLLQGKGNFSLVNPKETKNGAGYLLSAPNTTTELTSNQYIAKNALNCSCNEHFICIASGLVYDGLALGSYEYGPAGRLASIIADLDRRYGDRLIDLNKKPRFGPKIEAPSAGDYYKKSFDAVMPSELKAKLSIVKSKLPYESFHFNKLFFIMNKELSGEDVFRVKDAFKQYDRCIFVSKEKWGADQLVKACDYIGIPHDGDCLLPAYSVSKLADNILLVQGLNPQRSVVVPSAIDWLDIVKGRSYQESFSNTNNLKWHGFTIPELKKELESLLNR